MIRLLILLPLGAYSLFFSASVQAQVESSYLIKAEQLVSKQEYHKALSLFEQALKANPQSFAAAYRMAEVYADLKENKLGILYCNLAMDILKNFRLEAYRSLELPGHKDNAQRRREKIDQDLSALHHLKGKLRREQQEMAMAQDDFESATHLDPDNAEAWTDLGLLHFQEGRTLMSIDALGKAYRADTALFAPVYNLALVYHRSLVLDSAIFYYEKSVEIEDKAPNKTFLKLGDLYLEKNHVGKAEEAYTRHIQRDSSSIAAIYKRATLRSQQKRDEEALKDWNRVLSLDTRDADAYRNRGLSKLSLGDYNGAIIDFTASLHYKPSKNLAYLNRGYVYFLLQKYKKALSDYDRMLEQRTKMGLIYYYKAMLFHQQKKKKKTCTFLQKALKNGMQQNKIAPSVIEGCS